MKIKDLIERLKLLNQDAEVILSSDGEGNGFEKLRQIEDNMVYSDKGGFNLEIGFAKLTNKLKDSGFTEEDIKTDGSPCVVFWP